MQSTVAVELAATIVKEAAVDTEREDSKLWFPNPSSNVMLSEAEWRAPEVAYSCRVKQEFLLLNSTGHG